MHIAEGFLPPLWALFWFAVALPFFVLGLRSIRAATTSDPAAKLTLGLSGAFAFVLSALKMPSVSGSSSHPTGVALGAILCGPLPMVVLGTIVLLFQAILLAHGGLTTLGANVFSMAVVGPFVGYAVYRLFGGRRLGWAVFAAATVSDLATYFVTAGQLALAFPSPTGGVLESLVKFLGVFAFTQIPLAVSEGILTSVMFQTLAQYDRARLVDRGVIAA
jgi:cobalt/nickel transport system permease protein